MNTLFRISNFLDNLITKIGVAAAWTAIPLILVIIFDVITRRFLVLGSTKLQEMEWHLHTILFAFCLGYAYLRDSHVRIELVRERLSQRTQWWIELLGCLLFLIPYSMIVLYHGGEWWSRSFFVGEDSDSATGLPFRWIIKMALPLGFVFLLLATIAIFFRKVIQLFGPPELRDKVTSIENKEFEHLDDITPVIVKEDGL
ncbi:MAG: TRAP transporter small permease subunit [Alphaproteobacteria bacterium]|jgi:TRAP-type mannitol/chloroaromatic compound transport system permease small subunit|nr:TRAP transporter small permease subunit [Alphaproteobacteria bacterium]